MADKFAIITGASTGIGFELAHLAAKDGYDLLIVADEPLIEAAAADLQQHGVERAVGRGRPVDDRRRRHAARRGRRPADRRALRQRRPRPGPRLPRSGRRDWRRVVDTNITGTLYLLQKVLKDDGRARRRQGADHRLDRRLHPRHVPGGLQRHQGVRRQLRRRDPQRDQGWPTASPITTLMPGPGRDRILRPRRHGRHQGRRRQTRAIPPMSRKDGWDALMDGRGAHRLGLEEQAAGDRGACHARVGAGRAAPQDGRTRHRTRIDVSGSVRCRAEPGPTRAALYLSRGSDRSRSSGGAGRAGCERPDYFPLKLGRRFSPNALTPSMKSPLRPASRWPRRSVSSAVS